MSPLHFQANASKLLAGHMTVMVAVQARAAKKKARPSNARSEAAAAVPPAGKAAAPRSRKQQPAQQPQWQRQQQQQQEQQEQQEFEEELWEEDWGIEEEQPQEPAETIELVSDEEEEAAPQQQRKRAKKADTSPPVKVGWVEYKLLLDVQYGAGRRWHCQLHIQILQKGCHQLINMQCHMDNSLC